MTHSRPLRMGLSMLCLASLTLTACGIEGLSDSGPDTASCDLPTEEVTVKLGVIPGAQDMVTYVMESQGIAKKHKLKLDTKKFQKPAALHAAMGQRAVDVGFGGVTALAVLRERGRGTVVFDALTSPSNIVAVPKNSPMQSLSDIKGRKLGAFGGRSSATFAITSIVAKEKYGVNNLGEDAEVIEAPDAAVLGLLDQGKVDAALVGTTATVKALLSGKYKELSDISADYQASLGKPPAHVLVASYDEYVKKNCGALKAFSAALDDSIKYIKTNDQVWADYAKEIELTDPKAPALLKERVGSRYIDTWDQAQADAEADLIKRLIPVLGAKDFVAEVPEGLFQVELKPAS